MASSHLSVSPQSSSYGSISRNSDVEDDVETAPVAVFKDEATIGGGKFCLRFGGTRRFVVGAIFGAILGGAAVLIGSKTFLSTHRYKHKNNGVIDNHGDETKNQTGDGGWGKPSYLDGKDDPFRLSPVEDMGMLSVERNDDATPSEIWGNHLYSGEPLPTNSWYLNLVSHRAAYAPDDQTRVYTIPYIVDTASPFPGMEGMRVHWPVAQASDRNVQMVDDFKNSLCIGAEGFGATSKTEDEDGGNSVHGRYRVTDGALSPLGVGLEWGTESSTNSNSSGVMSTSIVRGMPYVTMKYDTSSSSVDDSQKPVPTIYSYNGLASDVQIDRTSPFEVSTNGSPELVCGVEGTSKTGKAVTVQSHLHLHTVNSDFTWMVFFNKPVKVSCVTNGMKELVLRDFKMTFVEHEIDNPDSNAETEKTDLVVRVALLNQCTTGHATIQQHCQERNAMDDPEGYELLLKNNAHLIPQSPTIDFEYSTNSEDDSTGDADDVAKITIDWDVACTKPEVDENEGEANLLMFALPHHQEILSSSDGQLGLTNQCVHSFHGNTCLVGGSEWILEEDLGAPLSFDAPRPPSAEFIPTIAKYVSEDIGFKLPKNTMRGASDTYFSGKLLARVARVIVIASELKSLASASSTKDLMDKYKFDSDLSEVMLQESMEAASSVTLPSSKEISNAVDQLKNAVTAWLKSDAEAPYIYDETWGGLVNCGCKYVGHADKGHCNNTFPECPALLSVNEDFGNGYYNDHHYHYGYHVYAAAVVAKFDHSWGRKHFDEVLLYIRDFANPYEDDEFFPQYRQKDWFLGSSWASGIISAENSPHGRNEESSSEAISAYEGVTLFGSAMVEAFQEVEKKGSDEFSSTKLKTAMLVRDSGQLLTASEIHATNRYWHVWSSDTHNNTYPAEYAQPVIGMLYDTMGTFQTWFAPWAVVSYGIQLIPLTPVAETRDNVEWATELYPLYKEACSDAGDFCEENGWSILQAGLLATTGDQAGAIEQAESVPKEVFSTDGGVGNSMTNTIWYIATRKQIA